MTSFPRFFVPLRVFIEEALPFSTVFIVGRSVRGAHLTDFGVRQRIAPSVASSPTTCPPPAMCVLREFIYAISSLGDGDVGCCFITTDFSPEASQASNKPSNRGSIIISRAYVKVFRPRREDNSLSFISFFAKLIQWNEKDLIILLALI